MHKVAWFVKFRNDLGRAQADQLWAGPHARDCLALPGLVRLVQNPRIDMASLDQAAQGQPRVDGFSAMWWPDREAFLAATASPAWQAMITRAHSLFEMDAPGTGLVEVDERVARVGLGASDDGVSTPPAGPIKFVGVLYYRPELSREEAHRYWLEVHGPIGLTVQEIGHYTQNHVRNSVGEAAEPAVDGFSESWYADVDAYAQAMASPGWAALSEDGPKLFDLSTTFAILVEERVLLGYRAD